MNMIEVNLDNTEVRDGKKPCIARISIPVRYYVVVFALISPFVVSYLRTIINFAIIDMIEPTIDILSPHNLGLDNSTFDHSDTSNSENFRESYESDNSCYISDEDRAKSNLDTKDNHDNDTIKSNSRGDKFQWDSDLQGLLKAAYAIGHAPLQISGGRLSEMYGSRWVMGLCSLAMGICCFMAPLLAAVNFYLLFSDLIMLGVFGSFMTPAIFTLFSRWLTPGEKSLFVPFYMVASRLGYGLSSLICGIMFKLGYSWRHVYLSAGLFSAAYAMIFMMIVRSRPQDHPMITSAELNQLASKNPILLKEMNEKESKKKQLSNTSTTSDLVSSSRKQNDNDTKSIAKKKPPAPWLEILSSVPVWAFVMTKFCVKLAGDAISNELPIYLQKVMHYPNETNGFVNAINYAVFCVGSAAIGSLSKYLIKNRPFGMSKSAIRKTFQSIASFTVGSALFLMALSVCNRWATESMLIVIMFFTTFGAGGEIQCPLDLSNRYSGTIHAIASTAAITGIIEPTFVGIFMKGHQADHNNWTRIWMGASAISFLGGFVFLLFSDSNIQSFDSIEYDDYGRQIKTTVSVKINKMKADIRKTETVIKPTYRKNDIDSVSATVISTNPDARDANEHINSRQENGTIKSSAITIDSN